MTKDEARKNLFSMMRDDEIHAKTLVKHYSDQFESLRQQTIKSRRDEFLQEIDSRIADENEKLRAFAVEVMEAWPDGGIEGDDLQEIAHKHGMLAPEIRHEPCGEWCNCNAGVDVDGGEWDRGVECYRRTALLTGVEE